MSIASSMKLYLLQKYVQTYDELGTPVNAYVDIKSIDVTVNNVVSTDIENGIAYTITTPTGITSYNEFDLSKKYRLVGVGIYEITGINQSGRYTQLMLKEVLI
jgi:hypothetical protein